MKSILICVLILFSVSGCATKYQPDSFTGGFSETQLGENMFNITFIGNGYTSRERASDFALLRSAEITLNKGYSYFIITSSEKYTEAGSYTTPIRHNTTLNTYGNTIEARTRTSGGQTINFSTPSTNNTIICYKEKPNINGTVYEANFLVNSIKSKYEIKD